MEKMHDRMQLKFDAESMLSISFTRIEVSGQPLTDWEKYHFQRALNALQVSRYDIALALARKSLDPPKSDSPSLVFGPGDRLEEVTIDRLRRRLRELSVRPIAQ